MYTSDHLIKQETELQETKREQRGQSLSSAKLVMSVYGMHILSETKLYLLLNMFMNMTLTSCLSQKRGLTPRMM